MRAYRSDRKPILVRLDPRVAALLCAGVVMLVAGSFATGVFFGRRLSTGAPAARIQKVAAAPVPVRLPPAQTGGASGSAHPVAHLPTSTPSPGSAVIEKDRLGALAAAADRAVVRLENPAELDDATSAGSARPAIVSPAATKEAGRGPGTSQPASSAAPTGAGPARTAAASTPAAPAIARPEASAPPVPGSPPREQPAAAHLRPAAGHPATVHFTLQVSSFQDQEEANELVRLLRSHGYNPYLIVSSVPERGQWYRVRVGKFSDRKAAEAFQSKLEQQENLKAFVSPM